MKKFIYFAGVALAWAMTSCSADEIVGLDPNGRPNASDINATITVNQETNQVTFTLDNPGAVPMWALYKNGTDKDPVRSTRNGYNEIIPIAGTYVVEVQMYNRNGICDGSKLMEFTIDNTIVDWNRYMTPLTGGSSKTWEMAHNIKAHLGCGEPGTDGTNWWSAAPEDKAGWGLYENRLVFTDDGTGKGTGKYTFDPGESGTIYVNTGINDDPFKAYNTNDGADYNYPIPAPIETTFSLQMEGNDLFLVLPAQTPLIYVPNMECWNMPKFKVNAISSKMIELTHDNGGIAWHYILQPEGAGASSGDVPADDVQWVDVNSPDNLMNSGALELASTWWADDNWSTLGGQPTVDITGNNAKVTVVEQNGGSQWQGQVHLNTGVAINEGTAYDFKVVLAPSAAIKGATVKPHPDGDDGHFFSEGRHDLEAYSDNVVTYKNFVADFSTNNLVITLDFPSTPAGATIDIKDIIIQEHRGGSGGSGSQSWVDEGSADNLLNSGALGLASTWWANNDWGEIGGPSVEVKGNAATVVVNEANGSQQWQGQVHMNTGVAISEGTTYDFRVILNPTSNINGATVKPHPEGDDGHFFSEGRHDLVAYEDNEITYTNFTADFSTNNLVITFDFPSCPAGTTIEISGIIIQEHRGGGSSSTSGWVDINSADNLINSGALGLVSTWWANNDWGEIGGPSVDINGNTATVVVNEANGSQQWQGQVHLKTGVAIAEGKTYDFKIELNPTINLYGATVKPHPEGDDGHFFSEGRHDLAAYEDNEITYTNFTADFSTNNLIITLDFPSCPSGTVIEVGGIIIQEHK